MGDADPVGHLARIVDVLAGAARALAADGHAVVVELEGDPDHVVALLTQQGGGDGGVDTAGHGDNDARVRRPLCNTERVHGRKFWGDFMERNISDACTGATIRQQCWDAVNAHRSSSSGMLQCGAHKGRVRKSGSQKDIRILTQSGANLLNGLW